MEKRHGSVRCFDRWVCGFFSYEVTLLLGVIHGVSTDGQD